MELLNTAIGVYTVRYAKCTEREYQRDLLGIRYPTAENEPGYAIVHPDGRKTWMKKDVFKEIFFPIEREDRICENDVNNFIHNIDSKKTNLKTCVMSGTLKTGYEMVESESCLVVEDYNHMLGTKYTLSKFKDNVQALLAFVLSWSKSGLKKSIPSTLISALEDENTSPIDKDDVYYSLRFNSEGSIEEEIFKSDEEEDEK